MEGSRHPRHRAVATMDAYIAEAEQLRDAQALVLQSLTAAGHNVRRATMLLKLTEERLEQLRTSRNHLVVDEERNSIPPER